MATTDGPGSFAALLRQYRANAGFSQEELAELAGLSRRGISGLERGERRWPHQATVRRLAAALNLDAVERAALLASAQSVAPDAAARIALPPLPVAPSSFVGRERELAHVRRLLGCTRLLTLTGAGGSGKTRLALEAARASVEDYPDGAALVLLAQLADPELVAATIAQVLGVRDIAGQPLIETLKTQLRPRRLLLLLDNFEHLLSAAPLVGDLLAGCPRLVVLATSREALRLREEQEFPVPPLELPPVGRDAPATALLQCASVELFAQRAAQMVPDFTVTVASARTVADICLRLDGLPLAIELAAARAKVLSPSLLLERLEHRLPLLVGGARDLPARQRTLRDTIAWSNDLLVPGDQRLFRRLAVFAGGCTLEVAEAVCQSNADLGRSVLDGLGSLVDKHLLQREGSPETEPRFVMLETIREFALEQLQAGGELEEARQAHATYYLTWLAAADPRRVAGHVRGWVHRLDLEYDNLRAAMRWSLDHGDLSVALAAGTALTRYGQTRGHLRELRQWWEEALDRSVGGDPALWPTAAFLLAVVLYMRGEDERVFPLLDESLVRFRAQGHKRGMAHVLLQLGAAAPLRGDAQAAVPLFREAEALFRELGQHEDVAWTLWGIGQTAQLQGDYTRAEAFYTEALAALRDLRHPSTVAQSIAVETGAANLLTSLGSVAFLRGDLERADACLREGVVLCAQLASADLLAACVLHLAAVVLGDSHATRAARLLGAAEGLWGGVDSGIMPVYRAIYIRLRANVSRRLGEQAFAAARAQGQRMSLPEVAAYALDTEADPRGDDPLKPLTQREREVARLAARGLTNREIAKALVVAEGTARVHVEHVLAKLDLHSRAQLAAWGVERGVLTPLD